MTPGRYDITLRRGVSWEGLRLELFDSAGAPSDLSGCTAFAQVRKKPGGDIITELTAVVSTDVGDPGVIAISSLTAAQTEALSVGKYRWDLVTEKDGDRHGPWLVGEFIVEDIITKPA